MDDFTSAWLKCSCVLLVLVILSIHQNPWITFFWLIVLLATLILVKWSLGMPVYCRSSARLVGRTVVVTGGNAGVGLETAVDMATRGAKVVLGCRNEERAQRAVQIIKQRSSNSNVVYYLIDLADFDSIRAFTTEVTQKESRVDILVNNAGIGVYNGRDKTKQGFDLIFGTNHLGTFLLTYLLLDLLKRSAPSQIINLTSAAHYSVWKTLKFKDGEINVFSYPGSKIANIMHARELSKRYKGAGIRANAVHPGFVSIEIWNPLKKEVPGWLYKAWRVVVRWFALDCKGGAQTTIYVAVDESAQRFSGEYFTTCRKYFVNPLAKDEKASKELWEESMKQCGLS